MNSSVDIRVTSIHQNNREWISFYGVLLIEGDSKKRSVRDFVAVKAPADILPMEPRKGQHWRISGTVEKRIVERGGFKQTQFCYINPTKCEVTMPEVLEGFVLFIAKESDFKGIGPQKARELWMTFGKDIFSIMENRDADKLRRVLTDKSIDALFEGYRKYSNLRYSEWMASHRIPPYIQGRIFKCHSEESIDVIQRNPYSLVTFGMTFSKVDSIAQECFGIAKDAKRRLVAAVDHAVRRVSSKKGHTLVDKQSLKRYLPDRLDDALVEEALKEAKFSATFVYNKGLDVYHHTELLIMEKVVANRLGKLALQSFDWDADHNTAKQYAISDLPSLRAMESEAMARSPR
ncbi:MAG: helix-hairpin-helix domain-containing protein [Sedimenticola sp.]